MSGLVYIPDAIISSFKNYPMFIMLKRKIPFFIKSLRSTSSKRLLHNFLSLSFLDVINYLIPVFLMPYVIKIFGIEKFGEYMFAQSFVQYFAVLVDFGFNFYATREISTNKYDLNKVSKIFTAVQIIKLLLLAVSALILVITIFIFDRFSNTPLFLLSFIMVVGQFLFPVFVFQGYERMRPLTLINLVPKIICTGAIFLFVRNVNDFNLFVLLMSLGFVFSGILAMWFLFRSNLVKFVSVDFKYTKKVFDHSKHIFIGNSASLLYVNSNSFVLGLIAPFTVVGHYSIAEKIIRVTRYVLKPLSQALFPYYSERFSKQSLADSKADIFRLLKLLTPVLILVVIILLCIADYIVVLLNGQPNDHISYNIIIMSVVIIVGTYNNIIGVLGLINLGLERKFKNILLVIGVFNIIILFPLGYLWADIGASFTLVLSECLLLVLLFRNFKVL